MREREREKKKKKKKERERKREKRERIVSGLNWEDRNWKCSFHGSNRSRQRYVLLCLRLKKENVVNFGLSAENMFCSAPDLHRKTLLTLASEQRTSLSVSTLSRERQQTEHRDGHCTVHHIPDCLTTPRNCPSQNTSQLSISQRLTTVCLTAPHNCPSHSASQLSISQCLITVRLTAPHNCPSHSASQCLTTVRLTAPHNCPSHSYPSHNAS